MRLTPAELIACLNASGPHVGDAHDEVAVLHRGSRVISGAVIDSRVEHRDGVFVALVGVRDGHDFRDAAIEKGASAILQQRGRELPGLAVDRDVTVIGVDDPLAALTQLAREVRGRFAGPAVALTGSNGKTTTRALTSALLELRWPGAVLSTRGNFNNHLGVPLTLLGEPHQPAAFCIELGMSAPGENEALASIVRPSVGIVTSVALEHLEFMGSLAAIVDAELEVAKHIQPGGALVIPGDDADIAQALSKMEQARGVPLPFRVLRFGPASCDPDLSVEAVPDADVTRGKLRARDGAQFEIELALFGAHNLRNAAAAILAARHIGVADEGMVEALANVQPVGNRGRVLKVASTTVVADCYNANPGSMTVALRALAEAGRATNNRTIAVLGDMLELGETEQALHRDVGELVRELGIDHLFAVGSLGSWIADGARGGATRVQDLGVIAEENDLRAAVDEIRSLLADGQASTLLLKASRGIRLERVVTALVEVPSRD